MCNEEVAAISLMIIWEPNETLICTSQLENYGKLEMWTRLAFRSSVSRWHCKS